MNNYYSNSTRQAIKIMIFVLFFSLGTASIKCYAQGREADTSWTKLKKKLDAGYDTTVSGILYLQYTGEYNNDTIRYWVFDYNRVVVYTTTLNKKKYGDNRFKLDFNCRFPDGDYILEVKNEKGELFKLRFKFDGQPPGGCIYMIIEPMKKTFIS